MDFKVHEHLASKALSDVRSGHELPDEVASLLNSYPTIQLLRSELEEADLENVKRLTESAQPGVRGLGFSLLRGFHATQELRAFFEESWSHRADFASRYAILWRLLDFPDLDLSWHEEILAFIKDHWTDFLSKAAFTLRGVDGPESILGKLKDRLEDPATPETKKWAYLCCIPVVPDEEQARILLKSYVDSDAFFVSRVARDLVSVQ